MDRLSLGTSNFFVETTKVWSRHRHQCYGMLKLQGTVYKVHIFCEDHKILQNLPFTFDCSTYIESKVKGRFRKILWPSQNIWTLYHSFHFFGVKMFKSVKLYVIRKGWLLIYFQNLQWNMLYFYNMIYLTLSFVCYLWTTILLLLTNLIEVSHAMAAAQWMTCHATQQYSVYDSRFPKLSSKTSERWLGYFRCKEATTLLRSHCPLSRILCLFECFLLFFELASCSF